MKSNLAKAFVAVLLVVLGICALVLWRKPSSVAPIPTVFLNPVYTMESAAKAEKEMHRPVLLLATADWCLPCEHFKREALMDPKVIEAIGRLAIPVYLDTEKDPAIAAELKIMAIPTLYLMRDGRVVSKITGLQSASNVVDWLTAAAEQK